MPLSGQICSATWISYLGRGEPEICAGINLRENYKTFTSQSIEEVKFKILSVFFEASDKKI